ncbi:hypothetical protein CMT41_11015 [Colwellia sp. MT41]|uniref:hypothetical protein n=1 Tax=Colwellia sp. MT41 TaxID=58049 RepID=UPI00071774EF|nr:hypothetical protein [Colwellia sp. MT41]ALO35192.1 hypothetical protein CMT41_11015 [Colwellia sp. MT41]
MLKIFRTIILQKKWSDSEFCARLRYEYISSGKPSEVDKLNFSMAKLEGEEMSIEQDMQEERDSW